MKFSKWLAIPISCMLIASAEANFYLDQIPRHEDFCWVLKNAQGGDTTAQTQLGIMYAYGIGVNTNLAAAVKWWTIAANRGCAQAQYNLGNAYATGLGVPQDHVQGCNWFRASAQQSFAVAQRHVGDCYAQGYGVKKNMAEAIKWYKKAAAQGDEPALDKLSQYNAND